MITAVTEFKLKEGVDVKPILLNLEGYAVTYVGFLRAEYFVDVTDRSHVSVISTWERLEDWAEWELSRIREQILHEAETSFLEKPSTAVYKPLTIVDWID